MRFYLKLSSKASSEAFLRFQDFPSLLGIVNWIQWSEINNKI